MSSIPHSLPPFQKGSLPMNITRPRSDDSTGQRRRHTQLHALRKTEQEGISSSSLLSHAWFAPTSPHLTPIRRHELPAPPLPLARTHTCTHTHTHTYAHTARARRAPAPSPAPRVCFVRPAAAACRASAPSARASRRGRR
eukprot:6211385-Pleurochrysis_carterae.AAC.5